MIRRKDNLKTGIHPSFLGYFFPDFFLGLPTIPRYSRNLFLFLNSYFYPGWHPYGQAGWLPTTQVLKGSLLLNPVVIEKEKKR